MGVMPGQVDIDPEAWLRNFSEAERVSLAAPLLDHYCYLNAALTKQLFLSGLHGISGMLTVADADRRREWGTFLSEASIVPAEGEQPNPSDSGNTFTRFARDVGFQNVVSPRSALQRLLYEGTPVVFVDDLVGTGSQMLATLDREHEVGFAGNFVSFTEALASSPAPVYLAVAIATGNGRDYLRTHCPQLQVSPGNLLHEADSVTARNAEIWDVAGQVAAHPVDQIKALAAQCGAVDNPSDPDHWEGYGGHGLAVAFEHGAPDLTLPLLRKRTPDWVPLKERR